jgi:hypothetical protein
MVKQVKFVKMVRNLLHDEMIPFMMEYFWQ